MTRKKRNNRYKRNSESNYYSTGSADNPFDKYAKTNANQKTFRKILTTMVITFLALTIGILLFANNISADTKTKGASFIAKIMSKLNLGNGSKLSPDIPFWGGRRQNILLLGVDSNGDGTELWKGTRTDTIILLNIDTKTKTVNAISIPRDSKVYLPDGNGIQKINAAHAIGGVNMTIKTIEDTLGVRIDKYIIFHDNAVREIVGALGGVDIYVEKNMHYNDNAGHLHINFQKGNHHLDKNNVVEYLRFRHDAMGDIGRTQRQQWFLRGLLKDLQRPETITKIPQIIDATNKYVKTNMSVYELTQYAALAKQVDMDNIQIAMLPGAPNKHGYISYWILDPDKTQEVLDRLVFRITPQTDKTTYTASIMSTRDKSQQAQQLKEALTQNGIDVQCVGHVTTAHSQFIAHSKYVNIEYYAKLKKQVPQVKSKQYVYDPNTYLCADTDFTVILGGEQQ